MVHSSKKPYAPFGVATKRFTKIGFHPELDVSGAMKREITKVGPGSYNPKQAICKSKHGISWKVKLEAEEFSKRLGYRNAPILREREFYKSLRGPGTNDINEDYYKRTNFSVFQNTGFGTGKQFPDTERCSDAPPPATYQRLDKTSTLYNSKFSNVMPFEWDGFVDRFRTKDQVYWLPPNIYEKKDGKGITDILDKVVSLRGPYDLFTGLRDGSTIKNHFSPPKFDTPEYGYIKPTDIDIMLRHPSKRRYGKFSKSARYPKKPSVRAMLNDLSLCYRDPDDPGPAHYNMSQYSSIKLKERSLHPFDKSKANARPPLEWKIFPGPGRYNPKPVRLYNSSSFQ
ncbi:hypothetical protein NQ315_013656 [Exocentrus adspersus]|uniref:Uncharacterized protein n=1 Tax=Exocentrus adspersus TaxID=1586481 RepID=A0AAV8W3X9_9CUCU|nr:hypothetical protein NQ315_013656 [Exocentrus adspersus]